MEKESGQIMFKVKKMKTEEMVLLGIRMLMAHNLTTTMGLQGGTSLNQQRAEKAV
jgi:hypothetical protein